MAWAEGKDIVQRQQGLTLGWALTPTGLSVLKGVGMVVVYSGYCGRGQGEGREESGIPACAQQGLAF